MKNTKTGARFGVVFSSSKGPYLGNSSLRGPKTDSSHSGLMRAQKGPFGRLGGCPLGGKGGVTVALAGSTRK